MQTTQNSRVIKASPEKVFQALSDPKAIEVWQVPGDMTGKVHNYNFKVGGGYEMSLFYPEAEKKMKGKTNDKEDRFTSTFIEIIPNKKIVERISFQSTDPAFQEKMNSEVRLEPIDGGTKVTFFFTNIPKGIKPEDNEAGTISSLKKLADYVE
ncbi:MAG: SRPBCC domain-containing protein [Cytophagaceae bacterium]|nr:SRPBCC domain-containing protein [Cytophagaceae bacterium]